MITVTDFELNKLKDVKGEVYTHEGTLCVLITETPRYVKDTVIHSIEVKNKELFIDSTRNQWVFMLHTAMRTNDLDAFKDVDKVCDEYVETVNVETKKWSWNELKYIVTSTPTKRIKDGWVKLKKALRNEIRTSVYIIQSNIVKQ